MPSASWSVFERGIKSVPDPFSRVLICSQWIAPTSDLETDQAGMPNVNNAERAVRGGRMSILKFGAATIERSFHMHDPLMVTVAEMQAIRQSREQAEQDISELFPVAQTPQLKVVTAVEYKLHRALDRPINPSLRGLLLAWVIEVEQRYIKKVSPEKRLFLVWKKAQSLNETRMPKRLPDDKVRSIAETVTQAANAGTAGLKYRAYDKVAFNQNQ